MPPQELKELTLEESIQQVMQTLPAPIRSFLSEGKYTTVAKDLIMKYGLRIDQGGVLEREIMLLLMGIESPDEFIQALASEAQIPQSTISGVMQDINTRIFKPLNEQMKNGRGNSGQPQTQTARPSTPLPPQRPFSTGAPQSPTLPARNFYAPPPQSPAYRSADTKTDSSSTIAPLPPKTVLPQNARLSINQLENRKTAPEPSMTFVPQYPQPQPQKESPISPPTAATPLQQALRTVLPPANLPGTTPAPSDIIPPAPKAPQSPQYSGDPYREPIE